MQKKWAQAAKSMGTQAGWTWAPDMTDALDSSKTLSV